jgi:uncharacterized damage-inducible protein DinB
MNVEDFIALYEYVIESRQRFLASYKERGWEEFAENREASWNSALGVFIHLVDVEDYWLHYILQDRRAPRQPKAASFESFDDVEAFETKVTNKTRALLKNMKVSDLNREVTFWPQHRRKSPTANVLLHVFIDEVAHLGELICLMWQKDAKPPYQSWLRTHSRPAPRTPTAK